MSNQHYRQSLVMDGTLRVPLSVTCPLATLQHTKTGQGKVTGRDGLGDGHYSWQEWSKTLAWSYIHCSTFGNQRNKKVWTRMFL